MAAALAERFRGGRELCVLWLVGLAFPAAHCLHFVLLMGQWVADRQGGLQEKGQAMDVVEHRPQPWHFGSFQIL